MTLKLQSGQYRRLIDRAAAIVSLPPLEHQGVEYRGAEVLEALILQESSGNRMARRYEPVPDRVGRADTHRDRDIPGRDDGDAEDDASYGLCQIMGTTAQLLLAGTFDLAGRSLGIAGEPIAAVFGGSFKALYEPAINIAFGSELLRQLFASVAGRWQLTDSAAWSVVLARYNGGWKNNVPGSLRNQGYVDSVLGWLARVRADRELAVGR